MAESAATLIYLRDRSVEMLKKDLILKNPLRTWEPDTGRNTATPRMGLVVAPRGSGKTAVLVQFALDSLLRGNRVVHVSIGQSLEKTKEWYEDLFQELSRNYKLEHVGEVHSEIAAGRLIMTFNAGGFSAAKLEERLTDLIEQDIFRPDSLVIDGFDFENARPEQVEGLRKLVLSRQLHAWFSAVPSREDRRVSALGVPAPCDRFEGLFDCVLLLNPDARGISLSTLKSDVAASKDHPAIRLDPTTFLVNES
jgi:hypothetical protein